MNDPWSGRRFLETLTGANPVAAVAALADEVVWHVPGASVLGGGVHRGRAAVLEFLAGVLRLFPSGLRLIEAKEWLEADGCVVEALLAGSTTSGRAYQNRYVFVFERLHDKITAVREYTDTAHAERILLG